jgi:hypothetical protein
MAARILKHRNPISGAGLPVSPRGSIIRASISFLHGLASEELRKNELDYHDPDYELLITIRASKPTVI